MKRDTLSSIKMVKIFIIKFTPIITLKKFDIKLKLSIDKGVKLHKNIIHLRLAKTEKSIKNLYNDQERGHSSCSSKGLKREKTIHHYE